MQLRGTAYPLDSKSNLTPRVISLVENGQLHLQPHNPIEMLKQRVVSYFHENYRNRSGGSPLFTLVENLSPVVTVEQNFDSLLVPEDHVSRSGTDTYYVNRNHVLRSHTSAHQVDLIRSGLDNFLVVGDVYRRDDIKRSHYLCFHQMEGVRLFNSTQLFQKQKDLELFENAVRTTERQATHTRDTAQVLERNLKLTLESMAKFLYGKESQLRWVDAYFPFTHPSWELEVFFDGDWVELLGCGVIEQDLLVNSGVPSRVGWAFGMGLERLAMPMYGIPDIRLFWSEDPAFLKQFDGISPNDPNFPPKFVPFPSFSPFSYDVSFWVKDLQSVPGIKSDFADLARSIGGDAIEDVDLIDEFVHPKTGRVSLCYRILYRDPSRQLDRTESLGLHESLVQHISDDLNVEIR